METQEQVIAKQLAKLKSHNPMEISQDKYQISLKECEEWGRN